MITIVTYLKKLWSKKHLLKEIDKNSLPNHIGIIMDGNGRWAKKRGLPRSAGHGAGAQNLKTISEFAGNLGIKYMTAYAFSTENWKRPKEEVDALMELLLNYLKDRDAIAGKNIVIRVIGDRSVLTEEIQHEMKVVEEYTKNNDGLVLYLAINYGGRQEIVKAVKELTEEIMSGKIAKEDISDELISEHIYTTDAPDVDLIIRPSGEYRLSNFLLWQSAYTEFWFSDINWPDFTTHDFIKAILDFQNRNRRFGGI